MKYNKGQSTIEFILTFTATVGFIFLFLKTAINYTNGYMVQHAVFMASRGYLVYDKQFNGEYGDADAETRARKIFTQYLPPPLISDVDAINLKFNSPESGVNMAFVGAYMDFKQVFSLGFIGGKDMVKFRAESFLGREPTRYEGYEQTCAAIITALDGAGSACDTHVTLDDNGG